MISALKPFAIADQRVILPYISSPRSELVNGNEDFMASAFTDVNHAWIAGGAGEVFNTMNGGASWSQQFTPVEEDFLCMSFVDASTGFIRGDNGTIISTSDGGNSRDLNSTPVSDKINDIFMVSNDYGFAVTDNGTVLRLGSVPTHVNEITAKTSINIYPNPCSDGIIIEDNGMKLERIELADPKGSLIEMNIPDADVTRFSLKNLELGIYFITGIYANGNKTISKVIKL